jgi:glycosyltransferase involved in cell wall biosynthesis
LIAKCYARPGVPTTARPIALTLAWRRLTNPAVTKRRNCVQPQAATIVIVNDFGSVNGGISKVAIDSAKGLSRRGRDVIYFCAASPIDPGLAQAGVRVVCLDQHASLDHPSRLKGAAQNLWNGFAGRRLAALLAESRGRAAVLHMHGWSKALSSSVLQAADASGLPIALTLHDYFSVCPTGTLFHFDTNRICPLRPMSVACMTRQCDKHSAAMKGFRVLRQLIQQRVAGFPNKRWHLVGVSDFSLDKMAPWLPAGADCRVILNPNDIVRAPPATPGRNSIFMAVGRLSAEKGMTLFAQAARMAGAAAGFIGEGESRGAILTANPDAQMHGWLDHAATLAMLREARALVFPSIWPETYGLVVVEALACGIPVVVSDNTAAAGLVTDGETGLVFPSGDAAALADRLGRLRDDDALVERLGQAAYARYWADPTPVDRHLDALETMYGDMQGRQASTTT